MRPTTPFTTLLHRPLTTPRAIFRLPSRTMSTPAQHPATNPPSTEHPQQEQPQQEQPTFPSPPTQQSTSAPLPLPSPSSASTQLNVNGDGVKLDHLGPLVVNKDGSLSRIANWENMADIERKNTLRILGKRNQLRLEGLRAEGEGKV